MSTAPQRQPSSTSLPLPRSQQPSPVYQVYRPVKRREELGAYAGLGDKQTGVKILTLFHPADYVTLTKILPLSESQLLICEV